MIAKSLAAWQDLFQLEELGMKFPEAAFEELILIDLGWDYLPRYYSFSVQHSSVDLLLSIALVDYRQGQSDWASF